MLYYGAEWLVKGSSSLAKGLGIAPVVIGLTVVAFGTSAPELVVSLMSSIEDKSMIAVGNVIGSNICNISLVLGLSAVFLPVTSSESVVKRDIPIMIGISIFLLLISINSLIGRVEGAILFGGVILYTICSYHFSTGRVLECRDQEKIVSELEEIGFVSSRAKQIILIVIGVIGVIIGARLVVYSATNIMLILGVNEKFIGLTIVAFGTSLPELATSVIAAIRKEMDISIGNLVGSNVFNILSVLGLASLVRPIAIPGGFFQSGMFIDYLVMLATSSLPWLFMHKDFTVSRWNGMFLLVCYIGYIAYLVIKA